MADASDRPTLTTHGAATLPSVTVYSYNLELEDADGFIGDKARRDAFREALDDWRKRHKAASGEDPLGETKTADISKKQLDDLLASGSVEAAGIVLSAIEDYAQALYAVLKRFLRSKAWAGTEAIVFGGGFRGSRIGELAIGRAGSLLKGDDIAVDLELIAHDPDEAGLIGAAHLLPAWMLEGYDGILAVDVGGTNVRAGIVELQLGKSKDLSSARIAESHLWRHADEKVSRTETIEHLTDLIQALIKTAKKEKLSLAPVVGIGCPGIIEPDGSIARGAQNLPGNWESSRFNFPAALTESIPKIGDHETMVVMHNDAVVQGLSHLPRAQKRSQWGVLTIGTGLGNARFSTRTPAKRKAR